MADNVRPAQSPVKCQFCEETEEIKWLCFHCDLYLCEICNKRIHSKQKRSQGHEVIALADLNPEEATDTRRKVDLEHLTCEVHKGQKCMSFCLDCHVTLCLTCNEEHKDHNKKDMLKIYNEKLSEIQKMKQGMDEKNTLVEKEETKLTKIAENKSREYKKVKDDIDKREADIIEEVKKHSQKLHNEVDQVYKPILSQIQKNLSDIKQVKVQLAEKKDIVDNILHSEMARDVLDASKVKEDIPVPQQSCDRLTMGYLYTPGGALDSKVREIFGDIYKIPELKLVNTYQTELKCVGNIINRNKDEKIISSYVSDKLQRVRFDNDTMTVIKEEDIKVFDMALMGNGDVVISVISELIIYTKEGTIQPYKSFKPLYTWGVHVNRHNEVLVGLIESDFFTVTADSIRKVVVLNQSGDIQHTYQYTRDKQRLFTQPYRIITCQDTICVVDVLNSSGEGRVVALDYGGHEQWIYNGEGNEGQDKFYPTGMAVTSSDLILVADYDNHAIHVLNPGGQVMVCHQVKDLGVEHPISLCLDSEGLLWVGCFTEEDEDDKVHVLQGIV